MIPLEQKLLDLNLTVMSHRLETTLSEAAGKNLSAAATLEWLADMELEARHGRAIERRFKCSKLQAQPSIDAFHFSHHKSRSQNKNRVLRLLDLTFIANGTNLVLIGNPGVGKTFLSKIVGWRACQANQRVLFTTAMDMLNHLLASQVDHSLVRKLKAYTEPALLICDELGYLALDQQIVEPLLSGHLHPPQPETFHNHHHQHSVLRLGQHSLQYDHRHGDRRPARRELRDLHVRRRQPPQAQESESAGRVVCAGSDQAPRCGDIPGRRSPPGNPSTALPRRAGASVPARLASPPRMFNFSANHLFLLSRTEYRKCAVFLLRDLDTQRVYRLYDFTKALLLRPGSGLLGSRQGQQRRQTLPRDRIGPARHQALAAFQCSCSC